MQIGWILLACSTLIPKQRWQEPAATTVAGVFAKDPIHLLVVDGEEAMGDGQVRPECKQWILLEGATTAMEQQKVMS